MSVVTLVSVDDFVARLRQFPDPYFDGTAQMLRFLRENPVDPATLERYLFWNAQHYTRNLIDKTPLYELIAICWEIGQISSIHNHRDQNCWMAAPIGRLRVQNYRVLEQDLKRGTCRLEKTDALEMNRECPCAVDPRAPVHKVSNPGEFRERAVSLHVYSRRFDSCDVYSEEQQTCGTIGLSYTSMYGKRVTPA
ncbi:MAG TPA: cysteine dioxygenase family protein [Terriglobales bacterium]|nr:cysteine dioxygenase family protein [Terriglobales bacterium]